MSATKKCSFLRLLETLITVSYLVCTVCLLYSLFHGPIAYLMSGETKVVDSKIPLTSDAFPGVTVCRIPGAKMAATSTNKFIVDAVRNEGMSVEDAFAKAYYAEASEVLESVSIGSTLQGLIPASLDHFKPFVSDTEMFGVCFTADTGVLYKDFPYPEDSGSLHSYMIVIGFANNSADADATDHGRDVDNYYLYLHDKGEELMSSGATNLQQMSTEPLELGRGQVSLYNVAIRYHDATTKCDDSGQRLSGCVSRYLDSKYPDCVVVDDDEVAPDCDVQVLLDRLNEQARLRFEGYEYLRDQTNCSLPCHRYSFRANGMLRAARDSVASIKHLDSDVDAAAVIKAFVGREVPASEEVEAYTRRELLSDLGGTMGLFLGLSIYEISRRVLEAAQLAWNKFKK